MPRKIAYPLLALLLITAQTTALAHVYEHNAGTAQTQACSGCITATQLASACVDTPAHTESQSPNETPGFPLDVESTTAGAPDVRQRGPPSPLSH